VKACGSSNRKDGVYSFVAPFDGYLTGKAKGSFNLALDLRTNCLPESSSDNTGSLSCGNAKQGDDEETIKGAINAGTTYYVVVKGGSVTANQDGVFTLDLEMKPSVCANGLIEGGEECDDGAKDAGDGCDPTCKLEPVPSTRATCATAEPIALVEGAPGVFTASVKGGNWNLPGGGAFAFPCGVTTGSEAYFTVTPPIDGVLIANVDATYNITPGVRLGCPHSGTSFLTCSNKSLGTGGERVALPVTAGTTYWLILDAAAKQFGSYTMDLKLEAETCGDSIVSGGEKCDDGNLVNGDGCTDSCNTEPLAGVDQCPGYPVALTGAGSATRSAMVTVRTSNLQANYTGTCGGSTGDGVIALTSDIAGTLVAQIVTPWPSVLYSRTACSDSSTEVSCKAADPAKPNEQLREITMQVQPATPVYLFVDGLVGGAGSATLSLTVTP
jgi:cysteine-rich repeat protein